MASEMTPETIYRIAKDYTTEPAIIVSMAFVESSYCKNKTGDGGKSLGCLQLQEKTVLWFAKKDKDLEWLLRLKPRHLRNILLHNDVINIEIAARMFQYRLDKYDYFVAISRHNGGWSNHAYFEKVRRNLR